MPRVARIVVPGLVHHVTQRGNNRQPVFFTDDDRLTYLRILADQCRRHRVAILAYCLMDNHTHLALVPRDAASLAKAIGRTHWIYAQYVNRTRARSGHLWQNRFYSAPVEDDSCLLVVRYIERNPLRAGLCRVARKHPWSSAAVHCGVKESIPFLDLPRWKELTAGLDWEKQLALSLSEPEMARIRRSTHTGRPLAADRFLARVEALLGRRLRPLPAGRPRKSANP